MRKQRRAAHQSGLPYYPKLVAMAPFTPATGKRFLPAEGVDPARTVGALLAGARAAADYKATQHCIQFFGTSEIDWTLAPNADAQTLRVVDDTLTFSGSCHDPAA